MAFQHASSSKEERFGAASSASSWGFPFAAFAPSHAPWHSAPAAPVDEDMPDWVDDDEAFQATLGLPQEILLSILLELSPSERSPLARVSAIWRQLVQQSWALPWGSVINDLGFHVLVPTRILRQSIPVAAWTVPDFVKMPIGVGISSPPFEIPLASQVMGRTIQWRLRLTRTRVTDKEQQDLEIAIEAVRPRDLPLAGELFVLFCRLENPASYGWGIGETKKIMLSQSAPQAKALAHVHSVIADRNKGFLNPSDLDSITIVASIVPESHEYVTVFSVADCHANTGPDLLQPTIRTPVLSLPRKWNTPPSNGSQVLKREFSRLRPDLDHHSTQFWRVIMRRNNTFRPISPELKSYEEPFYAVFAHEVRESDRNKACLFIKYFDGTRLRFLEELFVDPDETFLGIIRRLGKKPDDFTLFEEVHSRRVDQIADLQRSLRSHDIGDGDIVVLVPVAYIQQVSQHYQRLVWTSPLVTVSPNMWHS